ncbi:MAG: o-succinylbenzoate synthase [Candidatus Hydrogenedens sp.]|nr:o-succinylbenzoate synthase [Candidatus Hydrogenedens sp.]
MRIASAEVYRYHLPLHAPLTLRGETIDHRDGLLLRLESEGGHAGWGDAAPLPGFSKESAEDAERVLLRCARRLAGFAVPEDYAYFEGAEIAKTDDMASVGFAVESAYFGMLADAAHLPLYKYFRSSAAHGVRLNALLTGGEEQVLTQAERLRGTGFAAAKLKVGGRPLTEDIALVRKVRELLPPPFQLRLDANRQWTMETAESFANATLDCRLDYIEEPINEPFRLVEFYENTGAEYAVDETLHEFHLEIQRSFTRDQVQTEEFAQHVKNLLEVFRSASAVVWKPSLIYLPNMGADILNGRFALPVNRLVISAAFESGVGIGKLAHLAAAYCRPGEPVGLDTYAWLADDLLLEPLPMDAGEISLMTLGGLSRGIDRDKVALVERFEG